MKKKRKKAQRRAAKEGGVTGGGVMGGGGEVSLTASEELPHLHSLTTKAKLRSAS